MQPRHQDAFSYYGGVCRQCLYDGEKTVVLRWEAGHPVFNPAFSAFITHYECKPVACRPGSIERKNRSPIFICRKKSAKRQKI